MGLLGWLGLRGGRVRVLRASRGYAFNVVGEAAF